jgi:glycosyltransferase involved in cell wall biosynthesis
LRSNGVDRTEERHQGRGLRILHIVRAGGYGTISAVAEIVPELEHQGAMIRVIVLNDGRIGWTSTHRKLDAAGVTFREIPIRRIRKWMHPKVVFRVRDVARIVRRLTAAEPDIIHCHGLLPLIAGLFCRHQALIVTTLHGLTNYRSLTQRSFRAITGLSDAVIALKKADAHAIKRWSKQAQVYLANNGVDASRWQQKLAASRTLRDALGIPRDAFVVGVLGRLSKEKGITPFLAALVRSNWLTRSDAHILLVGAGPEKRRIERLIKQQSLAQRTHFLGYREDMENVYRTLDALAVPSATESQPMVVLEAMACRVPVVAFSVGSIPDIMADGAGIPVNPGDYGAFTKALDRLRVSSATRSALIETAHSKLLEEYSACTVARDIMHNIYLPLIADQHRSE